MGEDIAGVDAGCQTHEIKHRTRALLSHSMQPARNSLYNNKVYCDIIREKIALLADDLLFLG